MKSQDIIKYALIVGGLYLLYRWAETQDWFAQLTGTAPVAQPPALLPAGTQPSQTATAPSAASQAAATPAATTVTAAAGTASIAQLKAAATSAMGATWNGTLTADQWNYLYTQISGVVQTADLFPPDDRNYPMTAEAYMAVRQAKGLSALAHWPPISAWAN